MNAPVRLAAGKPVAVDSLTTVSAIVKAIKAMKVLPEPAGKMVAKIYVYDKTLEFIKNCGSNEELRTKLLDTLGDLENQMDNCGLEEYLTARIKHFEDIIKTLNKLLEHFFNDGEINNAISATCSILQTEINAAKAVIAEKNEHSGLFQQCRVYDAAIVQNLTKIESLVKRR